MAGGKVQGCLECGKLCRLKRGLGVLQCSKCPPELQLSVPVPFLQVTMLGFAGTLQWQQPPGEGLLVTLPDAPPSPVRSQLGWAVRLEGVK